jgi:hypothetical protein
MSSKRKKEKEERGSNNEKGRRESRGEKAFLSRVDQQFHAQIEIGILGIGKMFLRRSRNV